MDKTELIETLTAARGRRRNGRIPVPVQVLTRAIDFLQAPVVWSPSAHAATIIDMPLDSGVADGATHRMPIGVVLDDTMGLCFSSPGEEPNIQLTGSYKDPYLLRVHLLCRSITHRDVD